MKELINKSRLGAGIYTVPEISRLLNFGQSKVRRYLDQYWDLGLGKELFNKSYSWSVDGRVKAVNFYVLIELYTFFQLQELGVKNRVILTARKNIAKEINSPYPFANAGILTDGKKIWYDFKDSIINADGSAQSNFVEIIKSFVSKIEFGENQLAEKFFPLGKGHSIIVDPHHQFGQPVIDGTNVNADVIFSMFNSGEKIDTISVLYDITKEQVKDAIAYCKSAA